MNKGTAAELTDLHSKSAQVLSNREMRTLQTSHRWKARHIRHREECSPNLLKINTPQYQHLVWLVLLISFSLLSVYVLGTAEKGLPQKRIPCPPLPLSVFPSQILLIGGEEMWKNCKRIVSLLKFENASFPFFLELYNHTKPVLKPQTVLFGSKERMNMKMPVLVCCTDRRKKPFTTWWSTPSDFLSHPILSMIAHFIANHTKGVLSLISIYV